MEVIYAITWEEDEDLEKVIPAVAVTTKEFWDKNEALPDHGQDLPENHPVFAALDELGGWGIHKGVVELDSERSEAEIKQAMEKHGIPHHADLQEFLNDSDDFNDRLENDDEMQAAFRSAGGDYLEIERLKEKFLKEGN